jgi:pimeloyl-ACP methyl ester carboxylesterase
MKLIWLKRLIITLIVIRILATPAFVWYLADVDARPSQESICCATPADFGVVYEEVAFTAVDGITLSGWFIPSQNGATVIVLHGYGAHRAGRTLRQVEVLSTHGYGILTYDLRGHGQSGGDMRSRGWQDPIDLEAALDYLQDRGDVDMTRIGIFGFSVGGQIALSVAPHNTTLQAIMADGPGLTNLADIPGETGWQLADDWVFQKAFSWRTGLEPLPAIVDTIGQISPRPIFLVQAGGEGPSGEHYFPYAGDPKELWIIPEATHGTNFDARPEEYAAKMLAFFDDALLANK